MFLRKVIRYKKLLIAFFLVLVGIVGVWQIDLMRHIFIYECRNMDDAWRIQFGFPPLAWFGITFPLQTSFDIMAVTIGVALIGLFLLASWEYVRRVSK